MLKQAAQSAVREQVGRSDLDTVLGARGALAVRRASSLQASLDAYRTGLVVTELNLPNARPPEEVKPAFDDVNSAQQDKDRLINEAQAYAAQGRARSPRRGRARAHHRRRLQDRRGRARHRRRRRASRCCVEQYKAAPEVTRKRLWLETVQQVLADNRKVVGGDGAPADLRADGRTGAAARPPPRPPVLTPGHGGADGQPPHRPTQRARAQPRARPAARRPTR